MAKRGKQITAVAVWVALLGLVTACADQRQISSQTPSVTHSAQSSEGISATADNGTRSRISEPESSAAAVPQTRVPTASASPEAPSASPKPSAKTPDKARESTKSKPASPLPSTSPVAMEITLSVVGNAKWGTVISADKVTLKKNDTVAALLIRTLKAHKLAFEKRGSGALFYMVGIDGLYELDDGPTSGWKYRVNGKVLGVGAGSVEPNPGDRVEWFYTSDDSDAEKELDGKGSKP